MFRLIWFYLIPWWFWSWNTIFFVAISVWFFESFAYQQLLLIFMRKVRNRKGLSLLLWCKFNIKEFLLFFKFFDSTLDFKNFIIHFFDCFLMFFCWFFIFLSAFVKLNTIKFIKAAFLFFFVWSIDWFGFYNFKIKLLFFLLINFVFRFQRTDIKLRNESLMFFSLFILLLKVRILKVLIFLSQRYSRFTFFFSIFFFF